MPDSVHLLLSSAIGLINYKPNGKRTLMTELSAETLAPSPEVSESAGSSVANSADISIDSMADSSAVAHGRDQAARPRLVELRDNLNNHPSQTDTPEQHTFPFAIVQGETVTEVPSDLYIPPAALEVFLDAFEGPLDLLLYLIKKQNLDILEIDVAELTEQYMHYVRLMDTMQFELAGEYLVMAAMMTEIKSRMLLPRSQDLEEDEDDPRAQLIRRLQEYERFKQAAEDIEAMPRVERDIYIAEVEPPEDERERPQPDVDLKDLLMALGDVLHRADMFESHKVHMEPLSTRERMAKVLDQLHGGEGFEPFVAFFAASEGRAGVVVTFLAIMELIKESLIEIVQTEPFSPIHIRAKTA
jgi:segregation and condensation protein A